MHGVRKALCLAYFLAWAGGVLHFETEARAQAYFARGELDGDRRHNLSDAVKILRYLFMADQEVGRCLDAADVDDDGAIQLTDAIYLLNFLFRSGPWLPSPFPHCGKDTTEDGLGCERDKGCEPGATVEFSFFGQTIETDGVFFVIDRSGSMVDSGELDLAKQEVIRVLGELDARATLGIVFFDAGVRKFPSTGEPANATSDVATAAVEFVSAVPSGSGSCLLLGLHETLAFASQSNCRRSVMLYAGDGGATCGANEETYLKLTVQRITAENMGLAQIHCVGIRMSGRTLQEGYLKQLAAANGGMYWRVD